MTQPVIVRNLLPGQYQIDNLVFGRHTTVRVESCEVKPYDINSQDYQTTRSDEMHFGWDQLKPTTIEITFHVMNNYLLPQYEHLIPNFWDEMPTVSQFQESWRGDDIRYNWGEMKPLYICGRDGITRTVFGRPGQFTYAPNTPYTEDVQCLGEFRRADAYSYAVNETVDLMTFDQKSVVVPGTNGDAPSWFRILMTGPAVNPNFAMIGTMLGDVEFDLNYTIAEGEVVEMSGYPWSRRVVSSTGENLSAKLIGDTPYLDRMRFDHDSELTVTMSAESGMTEATVAALLWYDAYQVVG
jgi:hypothetical protein